MGRLGSEAAPSRRRPSSVYAAAMTLPARNTLAIIGAGPVGLEALSAAIDAGFDVHLFERGEPAAHPVAWGHVSMFTPWRMNLGSSSARRLAAAGWTAPDANALPTGNELAERYLQPLSQLPEMKSRIHSHSRVVHVSRRGLVKDDALDARARAEHPFRLLVRDQGGRENFIHAFAVIDASGVYGQPNHAGDGGIPARNELYLAPQMSYHIDDVNGLRRERYAGKRTIVIGGGSGAATLVAGLVELAAQVPGTAVTWITREPANVLYPELPDDPLAPRRALFAAARGWIAGGEPSVRHLGGAIVDGIQYNSATHRYTVSATCGELPAVEEADQVTVNAGYGPDTTVYRELQVDECPLTRGVRGISMAVRGAASQPGATADPALLAHPEPNFYIVGHKSFGRSPNFLLEQGYAQVSAVMAKLGADLGVEAGS